MRSAFAIGGTILLLAVAGCGDDDGDSEDTQLEPAPATSVTSTAVNIVADCGPASGGSDESSVTAEGVVCEEALNVDLAFSEAGCDFSVEPECNVIGFSCIRASEEGAEVVVFECTKGDARVTIEAQAVG